MKFLLEQDLPRSAVAELIDRGFDAKHVGQLGPSVRLPVVSLDRLS